MTFTELLAKVSPETIVEIIEDLVAGGDEDDKEEIFQAITELASEAGTESVRMFREKYARTPEMAPYEATLILQVKHFLRQTTMFFG